jgi:hypothetical protein
MAESVKLQKSFSLVNERVAKLLDESGVRRSFTVPYVDAQAMDEHVKGVGQAAMQSGGLSNNLILTAHHSEGKGWGSGEGHTVGYPGDKLRNTVVPKDDPNAKAAIEAAQAHLNNIAKLLGDDDSAVKTANSQLSLVKKNSGAGMSLLDFAVMILQVLFTPNQAVARAHSQAHPNGASPQIRGPHAGGSQSPQPGQGTQPEPQGAPPAAGQAPEGQEQPSEAPAAPEAAPQGAPAAPAPPAQG